MSETWFDNGRLRLASLAKAIGFADVSAFAAARPQSSFDELAAALGDNVAISQLVKALMEEGVEANRAVSAYADVAARKLRAVLPRGWPRELDEATRMDVVTVLSLLTADLHAYEAEDALEAMTAFLTRPHEGWRPLDGDDPIVVELAERVVAPRFKSA